MCLLYRPTGCRSENKAQPGVYQCAACCIGPTAEQIRQSGADFAAVLSAPGQLSGEMDGCRYGQTDVRTWVEVTPSDYLMLRVTQTKVGT